MTQLVYDHTQLAEPNLLIPGKKPIGPVKINFTNLLTRGLRHVFLLNERYGFRDVITGVVPDDYGLAVIKSGVADMSAGTHVTFNINSASPLNWINGGITNYTLIDKWRKTVSNNSGKSGLQFHEFGSTKRVGPAWSGGAYYFMAKAFATFSASNILYNTAGMEWKTEGELYDGTEAVAGDRVVGWVNDGKHTFTAGFVSPLSTTYDKLYIGAYGYYSSTYDYNTQFDFVFLWDRTLSDEEYLSIYHDPYQFLISAG